MSSQNRFIDSNKALTANNSKESKIGKTVGFVNSCNNSVANSSIEEFKSSSKPIQSQNVSREKIVAISNTINFGMNDFESSSDDEETSS